MPPRKGPRNKDPLGAAAGQKAGDVAASNDDPHVVIDAVLAGKSAIRLESLPQAAARDTIRLLASVISKLTHVTEVHLGYLGLEDVPDWVFELPLLEELDLTRNKLKLVPPNVGRLQNLQRLLLDWNELRALPESVLRLPALTELSIVANKVEELPTTQFPATGLLRLSISDNPLYHVPHTFGALTALRALGISGTRIRELPGCIRHLPRLEFLAAGGNSFEELPDWIGELGTLKGLDLSHGNTLVLSWFGDRTSWSSRSIGSWSTSSLKRLPASMSRLGNLTEIYLHGNDQLQIPAPILGPDWGSVHRQDAAPAQASAILDYYFRTRRGRRPLNEAKLILVGRGGVGKTSLINQLISGQFDENEPETPGIQIQTWPVTLEYGDQVRLHVWDFGGQEILHATHQFFLTERALYLLVLSGREGNPTADAEYWLQLIKSFGGDSRVLIALNKSNLHPFDVNRGYLLEKYPFIAEFVATDCKTAGKSNGVLGSFVNLVRVGGGSPSPARGIPELKAKILELTQMMEHRKADFPADWFAIKERLAGMAEDFMSWTEYQEVCRTLGEDDPQAQRDLARFLHILGIALNYSDDPRLADTRVLKPRWVTEGIYSLLRAGQRTEQPGVLTMTEVAATLNRERYPVAKHQFLLRLMERFQLCFRLPGPDERYFVPEMLGENQPPLINLLDAPGLGFRYQYEVIPEGLLPRFIVQTHIHSVGQPRWRSGVVLERDGCRAVVRADLRDRRVDVHITGPDARRRGLLEVVRDKFEQQHRDLKGLGVDERVPMPDAPSTTVSYRHLLTLEEEGEEWIRPEDSRHKYRVVELLNGVETSESRLRRRQQGDGSHGQMTTVGGRADTRKSGRSQIFVSYSHEDRQGFKEFKSMLAPAIQRGIVDLWGDDRIKAGADWRAEINRALESARIAVLLVSRSFLDSEFIAKHELPPLLTAAQEEGVTVFWVCLSPCMWDQTEISGYQGAHDVFKPLSKLGKPQREEALKKICEKLLELAGNADPQRT